MDREEYVKRYATHFYKTFNGEMRLVDCLAAAKVGAQAREEEGEPFKDPEQDAADELACWDNDEDD